TQGLLFAGPPINWERQVGDGKSLEYWFYAPGGDSARVPYFPWNGAGENRIKQFGVTDAAHKSARFPDVAMISPATASAYGMSEPAYLVDVEVNSGAGGAGNELHFVGTKLA